MTLLNKNEILDAKDTEYVDLYIEAWKGTVRVSTITGKARDRFETSLLNSKNKVTTDNIRAKLVASCLVDEQGKLLFSEADIEKLGNKNAKVLDQIFAVAQKLNGIGNAEVEELAKN